MPRRDEIGNGNELEAIGLDEKRIWYGKYAGEKWTHLPKSYLKWMVNERTPDMARAEAELNRRGSVIDLDGLEIAPHAIDRCSQYCLDIWQDKREGNEGIHCWLHRAAKQALAMSNGMERSEWGGIIFVFKKRPLQTVLLTVIRDRRKKRL